MVNALALKEAIADIEPAVLEALGLDLGPDGVKSACPVHQGDNPTAFVYSLERRSWACWSHHCHHEYGADIIGLVMGVKQCTFSEAINWIVKELKIEPSTLNVEVAQRKQYIRKQKRAAQKSADPTFFDIRPFLADSDNYQYFYRRGLTDQTLKEFGCFVCKGTPRALYNRAVISVRDLQGRVMGLAARQMGEVGDFAKWMYFPEAFANVNVVGGLYESLTKYRSDKIALVEGYFDALRLYQAGFPSGCLLGTQIYAGQIRQLIAAGIKTIYLLLDPDEAGRTASVKIQATLEKYFKVINFTNKLTNDPGDLSDEALQSLVEQLKGTICLK